MGDSLSLTTTEGETNKRTNLNHRVLLALIHVGLGGCYGLTAVLFFLSQQWQNVYGNNTFLTDPYYGWAEAFAVLSVISTFVSIVMYVYKNT